MDCTLRISSCLLSRSSAMSAGLKPSLPPTDRAGAPLACGQGRRQRAVVGRLVQS